MEPAHAVLECRKTAGGIVAVEDVCGLDFDSGATRYLGGCRNKTEASADLSDDQDCGKYVAVCSWQVCDVVLRIRLVCQLSIPFLKAVRLDMIRSSASPLWQHLPNLM